MPRVKRYNYTRRTTPKNPFLRGQSIGTEYQETFQIEEAVVLDVVVNNDHPDYDDDGYNVGAIRFRNIYSNVDRSENELSWAFPLEANITDYPLLNEVVLIINLLDRFYYSRKLNVTSRVTSQPLFGLNDRIKPQETTQETTQTYSEVSTGGNPTRAGEQEEADILGNDFQEIPSVSKLRPEEGDIIYEGRTGQSIRFGSNIDTGLAPNVLIRCGPNPTAEKSVETKYGLISEDIDLDLSSIWMVADQVVPLTFSTVDAKSHFISIEDKPTTLDGAQIIINSDRVVLNSKRDRILATSFFGTHFSTFQDHTVDAEQNYKSFAGQNREINVGVDYLLSIGGNTVHTSEGNHSIIADKIFIGSLDNEDQPIVLGNVLREFIEEFLDIIMKNSASFTLPTVGIGPLNPAVTAQITALRAKYATTSKEGSQKQGFLSTNNFVTRE